MAYVQQIFEKNFLEYASYVIKDRAIPDLDDGLKPVQRRILHSLFEMDDGKFHKVANVVGHCMKYHPHGDASIYEALVNLANKELFIDTQGNFGNLFTGDVASAARYIECRIRPFAEHVLYNKEITEFQDSYDGRNREPVVFPAKLPVVLLMGAEGIAVGMSTKILPHNFIETVQAMQAELRHEPFQVLPDFPTGGIVDASNYADGLGKVLVRARLDTSDPKRIIIRELPFGQTTETLIDSIEQAARRGKIKIAGISDFTTENVEIEITLARGVYTQDTVDALYAFTACESSISCNLLVIHNNTPVEMTVSEVIKYHALKLVSILTAELELELRKLEDKLHARTLERIFIEERIYKHIEEMKTAETVVKAVKDGFIPFAKEIIRAVSDDDVETLLKIPIRRISLYDINKARKELAEIEADIKRVKSNLSNVTAYALKYLQGIIDQESARWKRKTEIASFDKIDVREVAVRNLTIRYDPASGYLGYHVVPGQPATHALNLDSKPNSGLRAKASKTVDARPPLPRVKNLSPDTIEEGKGIISGQGSLAISEFDRILVFRGDGTYQITTPSDRQFVGDGVLAVFLADKDALANVVFTVVYRNPEDELYIKRFKVEGWIQDKPYNAAHEGGQFLLMTIREKGRIRCNFVKKSGMRVLEDEINIEDLIVKGANAQGNRLTNKETESVEILLPART